MPRTQRRGFTLSALLAALAAGLVLVSILTVATYGGAPPKSGDEDDKEKPGAGRMVRPGTGLVIKCCRQLIIIHSACASYAEQDKRGRYCRPGLMWRRPVNDEGKVVIGEGPERHEANTTKNFYAAMIARNYIPPDVLISPLEKNPVVREDRDYDYSVIDPAQGIFWDPSFATDLDNPDGECNTSYAHLGICGQRKNKRWREETRAAEHEPVFSNRGVENGVTEGNAYVKSPTLLLLPQDDQWVGNIVFNDNHTATLKTFYPNSVTYKRNSGAQRKPDNIFAAEFGTADSGRRCGAAAADTWLIIAETASQDGFSCTAAWDALLDS